MNVLIAIGSNKGNRHHYMQQAHHFLCRLSSNTPRVSAMYLTEPVGPSSRYFLNGVIEITTRQSPRHLLSQLKKFEYRQGRNPNHERWGPRVIDLDILACDDLVIQQDSLIIPHPEYGKRLFMLAPLRDVHPHWKDPQTGQSIDMMIQQAPPLQLKRTTLSWRHGE